MDKTQVSAEQRKQWRQRRIMVVIILVLAAVIVALLLRSCGAKDDPGVTIVDGEVPRIGYANEGVTAVNDPDELQRQVDEMYERAREGGIPIEFQNDAYSSDGVNFSCYIGNPTSSLYDKFIAIYGDLEGTDELFVSQLIRPGSAFEKVTLNRALEKGDHRVYVAFSEVKEEDGQQVLYRQTVVTMDFHVT